VRGLLEEEREEAGDRSQEIGEGEAPAETNIRVMGLLMIPVSERTIQRKRAKA
jgi:hypothetical protein